MTQIAFAILAALTLAGQASAQTCPDRPVKFISSQAAGIATDMFGRLVTD